MKFITLSGSSLWQCFFNKKFDLIQWIQLWDWTIDYIWIQYFNSMLFYANMMTNVPNLLFFLGLSNSMENIMNCIQCMESKTGTIRYSDRKQWEEIHYQTPINYSNVGSELTVFQELLVEILHVRSGKHTMSEFQSHLASILDFK